MLVSRPSEIKMIVAYFLGHEPVFTFLASGELLQDDEIVKCYGCTELQDNCTV
jgi:hypothetical protein